MKVILFAGTLLIAPLMVLTAQSLPDPEAAKAVQQPEYQQDTIIAKVRPTPILPTDLGIDTALIYTTEPWRFKAKDYILPTTGLIVAGIAGGMGRSMETGAFQRRYVAKKWHNKDLMQGIETGTMIITIGLVPKKHRKPLWVRWVMEPVGGAIIRQSAYLLTQKLIE
jgi:hypothetical protein